MRTRTLTGVATAALGAVVVAFDRRFRLVTRKEDTR